MSPWHCCIAVTSRGEFRTAHKSGVEKSHRLVSRADGAPYCYIEDSPLFDFGEGVTFEFEFPRTLIVKATRVGENGEAPRLGEEGMKKVKELAKGFSPVITSGFVV
jgi:hypothetical protein